MSKRARYAPNHGTLATHIIHRRVFNEPAHNCVTNYNDANKCFFANSSTDPGPYLDFGFDDLPRTSGRVWAAEIVKINYQLCINGRPTSGTTLQQGETVFFVSTSNQSSLKTSLDTALAAYATIVGAGGTSVTLWGDSHVVDLCAVASLSSYDATATGTAVTAQTKSDDLHEEHDTTDTFGQGIVVFAPKVYLGHAQSATPTATTSPLLASCAAEIYFRYVEVPLEVYLSKQQDVGLINT